MRSEYFLPDGCSSISAAYLCGNIRFKPGFSTVVQGQYMPVHPDVFGQKCNLQFAVTPVIPKLIKGHLFGD